MKLTVDVRGLSAGWSGSLGGGYLRICLALAFRRSEMGARDQVRRAEEVEAREGGSANPQTTQEYGEFEW